MKRVGVIRVRFTRENRFERQRINDNYMVEDSFPIGSHGVMFYGGGDEVTRYRRRK